MSFTSPNSILFTGLSLAAAWLYGSQRGQKSTLSRVLAAVVILHTFHVLCRLVFFRPTNLFLRLNIPINAPVDYIRSLLLMEAGYDTREHSRLGAVVPVPPEIPRDIELLLTRLGVHDSRTSFVRFGQGAMQTCQYCSSAADYALFTLSGILLEYLRTATLLLLLTTKINGRQRLRTITLGALTSAFLAEVYAFISASNMPLAQDAKTAFMWHDRLFLARNVLLVFLPIITQVLPAIYAAGPASVSLAPALGRLERALPRAHLLKYTRQAILRRPDTRERAVRFWAKDAAEGEAARSDATVQMTAFKLGLGFRGPAEAERDNTREGFLRANARMALQPLQVLFTTPPS
ncbi:hypothetical protein PAXRUDRAFT_586777 [Paxillus rubicundulus Ve08.2h10]|uniref:Uncharacterized protein n=1 Tax=Paxillus rubicundulus Ve08.2h10 TaxID=930991 RepID=A0A0D0E4L4_9AGAM|nr:hypothetical protein PAXRUDRAFT_586777 [Paxillus rubicundulus Ve08.2h10]